MDDRRGAEKGVGGGGAESFTVEGGDGQLNSIIEVEVGAVLVDCPPPSPISSIAWET